MKRKVVIKQQSLSMLKVLTMYNNAMNLLTTNTIQYKYNVHSCVSCKLIQQFAIIRAKDQNNNFSVCVQMHRNKDKLHST